MHKILFAVSIFWITACSAQPKMAAPKPIITGAEQMAKYLPSINGQRIALVVNQTSVVKNKHLVDTLHSLGIEIAKAFSPEHGFRGNVPDGEKISNGKDEKTGIPIVSLYGNNKKPTPEQLSDVDIVIFDIQDVGARFYTYISTLHVVMEACAENGKKIIVLDRPNPNGQYVDGPIREDSLKSFVGMHPIPIVHGLTIGELAEMINGEGWLEGGVKADLQVIPVSNYDHQLNYPLPIKTSPNLPNDLAVKLYPSLCLFEGTTVSLGRGTYFPFQVIGYPDSTFGNFSFTPVRIDSMSKYPPLENQECFGVDFRKKENIPREFSLSILLEAYERSTFKEKFFNNYFSKLAGTTELRMQIEASMSEEDIRKSWEPKLGEYKELRKKYLLYPDFN